MSATAKLKKDHYRSKETLSGCSAIITGFSETHCERFVSEAGQSLFEHAKSVHDNNEQRRFDETNQYLESNSAELYKHFEAAIQGSFGSIYSGNNQAAKAEEKDIDNSPEDLTLVGENEVEIDVAISSMSRRIDSRCTQALYGLTQRMAMLNEGIKIDEEHAPYAARFLIRTFFQFIEKTELELSIQLLLLKLFERSFVNKLPNLYRELNNYLVTSNVLPNLRYGKGSTRENNRRKTDQVLAQSETRQTELYETLSSLFNGSPQPINSSYPVMSVDQALDELSSSASPNGDLFAQPASFNPPNTNSISLQHALDCVTLLFEMVDDQDSLGTPVKNLLSHLQNPYARIALSDPSFFADPQHQARQLMHSLVSAVEQWTDEDTDPTHELLQHIKSIVERVASEASNQQSNSGSFESLLEEFSQYIDNFERKIRRTEQRSVEAAEGRERLQQNQNTVDELITSKTNGQELPKPVASLLLDTWASYMTYILLRYGENSEQWDAASTAVDSILWYIEPKTNDDERKKAQTMKTTLHGVLRAGMEQVGLTTNEIKGRLKGLELCQQLASENMTNTIASSQPKAKTKETANTSSASTTAHPKKSKAQQTKKERQQPNLASPPKPAHPKPADTASAQAESITAKATLKNPADTKQLPPKPKSAIQRQQEKMQAVAQNEVFKGENVASEADIQAILSLKFGTWLDWQEPDKPQRRLKLTWYNRRSTNCMLSNKAGQEVGIFSAKMIANGIANGHIKVVDQSLSKPLFERVLEKFGQKYNANN